MPRHHPPVPAYAWGIFKLFALTRSCDSSVLSFLSANCSLATSPPKKVGVYARRGTSRACFLFWLLNECDSVRVLDRHFLNYVLMLTISTESWVSNAWLVSFQEKRTIYQTLLTKKIANSSEKKVEDRLFMKVQVCLFFIFFAHHEVTHLMQEPAKLP